MVAAATVAFATIAQAHPHGTVQCAVAVDFKDGQPHRLTGRLLFDQTHSTQALAVLRDPVTQKLDGAMQVRFLFGLRQQLARWNWLFAAKSDGIAAELAEMQVPTLWWSSDGRLGVSVVMAVAMTVPVPASAAWVFTCQDPTLYWVSEFLPPEAAITLTGCDQAVVSPAIKVATGPLAGTARVEVRCMH